MKISRLLALAASLLLALNLSAATRDALWTKVKAAQEQKLPQSAIASLDIIIASAQADHAWPEVIKATVQKISLESSTSDEPSAERIIRLIPIVEQAPSETKPLFEAILARGYWDYIQRNRTKLLYGTPTEAAPGPDFRTWDIQRLMLEADHHFTAALADAKELQRIPVADYDVLLEPGTAPDATRPTLYDFLANEALSFYQSGERDLVEFEDNFEVSSDSPIYAPAADFISWRPIATDAHSPSLKALRLYQQLLEFHRADRDLTAYYDTDLSRLIYAHRVAVGDNSDQRYQAAVEHLASVSARNMTSARALAELASLLMQREDYVGAHALASRGAKAFPQSNGGARCETFLRQIETQAAEFKTESVWNAPWPTLDVTYRNITKVYFRVVAVDAVAALSGKDGDISGHKSLLNRPPALSWQSDLPATGDYKPRMISLPAPATLKPGLYCIFASRNPDFSTEENQVSSTPFWVSNLALITQSQPGNSKPGGFVLQAVTGEPVANATVRVWQVRASRSSSSTPDVTTQTDQNGQFFIPSSGSSSYGQMLLVTSGDQAVSNLSPDWNPGRREEPFRQDEVIFFTDRAIYRPGQTIYYKGIDVASAPAKARYAALTGKSVTVIFFDSNNNEIARTTHRTNAYGSFSGTFTAPRDRALGRMSLRTDGSQSGDKYFSVEEYKRPKFQVAIAPPTEAPRLGAITEVTVKATSYTGAAVDGAKIRWRVEREVQLPPWCQWWQPLPSKSVAHGTAVTSADGTLAVRFTAEPDRSVPEQNEPVFTYTIHADVTDTNGETRSADYQVNVGYTALKADISADAWQTSSQPVICTVTTRSLDGTAQVASGLLSMHALRQPSAVVRDRLYANEYERDSPDLMSTDQSAVDPTKPETWADDRVVYQQAFTTAADGTAQAKVALPAGYYRASLETKDRFGKKVTARSLLRVIDPQASHLDLKIASLLAAPAWSVEPGQTFTAVWGTGYASGRAFVQFESNGRLLKSGWTTPGRTQDQLSLPITEKLRGGVTMRVTFIRENRSYSSEDIIAVPWSDKHLAIQWETFRSKLLPGQAETWTAMIRDSAAKPASAEMVATLYDASLDQFALHSWSDFSAGFRWESSGVRSVFYNVLNHFRIVDGKWSSQPAPPEWSYRKFTVDIDGWTDNEAVILSPFQVTVSSDSGHLRAMNPSAMSGTRLNRPIEDIPMSISVMSKDFIADANMRSVTDVLRYSSSQPRVPDLNQVTARKNLSETAFFFPHLLPDENGRVKFQFTMPEALTEWRFLGFAHDADLRSGLLTGKVVTSKNLMVEPNPPRFVREGDVVEFTAKVTNRTDQPQAGRVRLTLADAATLQPADGALGNTAPEQAFTVPAHESRSYAWRLTVPDGACFLTYKVVGASASASDGEEGFLPVLSRRILITESLPLAIRDAGTKSFEFTKLLDSGSSDTLRHQSLTVQMTSQPAWYAVMALPYLMEFPYECSEQVFNRLYANALARHIANSDPKISRIFEQWRNTPALDSPLAKNQDLKSLMIEETPWLAEATAESQARRNVGLLFEANHLDEETARALRQLSERQLPDGRWSWFPGGPGSDYISLYIVAGFGRLRHLGVEVDATPALKALAPLDERLDRRWKEILQGKEPENYVPTAEDALQLYARSFFLKDQPVAASHRAALDFFLAQARKHWTKVGSRQSEAHLALALQRFGDKKTPQAIARSLKERSITSEEMGRYWRDERSRWSWSAAPIETQAMMIEVFDEVAHDAQAVDDCQVWLLKQKQTQNWPTTKATADAIYSLLLRGNHLLASDALVTVALAGVKISPEQVEAGTGRYEKRFTGPEIKPAMGHITVQKTDAGVSWGGVHWQYLEDMRKITPHEGTPLSVKKTLFLKENTARGPVLKPVTGPLSVGDELVVRLELRADRDMEYVHLKDQRGSGTEPVSTLSEYRWQDGLGYYESTRDTASHFFIERLPQGTYVLEYSTRIQLRGTYQSGIAELQCMYAPEFNSHSESQTLEVK